MNEANNDNNTPKPEQREALIQYDNVIRNYQRAPFEAGRALESVRDQRLYRFLYPNFDAYTLDKYNFCRSKADRLIWLSTVDQVLTPIGVKLENEYQARPLLGFTKDQILEAGKMVLETSGGKKLTAEHFQLAAQKLRPHHKKPVPTKASTASAKSVAKVLGLVSAAEAALMEEDNAKVLEALAGIKACLTSPISDLLAKKIIMIDALEKVPEPDKALAPTLKTPLDVPVPVTADSAQREPAATATPKPKGNGAELVSSSKEPKAKPSPGSDSKCFLAKNGAIQPSGIRLGTTEQPITRWNEVPIFAANWLLAQGLPLPSIACVKRSRLAFSASARIKQLREDWFIDVGDGQQKLLRNARQLLQKSGHGDVPITVKLTNGDTLTV